MSGTIGTLAETWSDSTSGGTGATYGSLAAVTAGGRNVTASVVDCRTVRVSFNPNADGSFRVLVGAPAWTGGNAASTASALFGSATTQSSSTLSAASLAWWHSFWSTTDMMKLPSDVWWWNARMQVDANMTAGAAALNTRWFNLYTANLAAIQAWTSAHVPGRAGACVPETPPAR